MAATVKSLFGKLIQKRAKGEHGDFSTASEEQLFPATNPQIDGEDCIHDCESCTTKYPFKFSIDETDKLYGFVNGWNTHLLVATGKTDWVRDVANEKGSIMEAVNAHGQTLANGKLMLSASNMTLPPSYHTIDDPNHRPTTVLVLPAFKFVDNVTPASVPTLLDSFVGTIPTNISPLEQQQQPTTMPGLDIRNCPHQYLILLCSQNTRDARCGQSAPLLKKEFERHLRPLGLHRDSSDERPGGVGIYFISHVGGHKYSANCMIYRRAGSVGAEIDGSEKVDEQGQGEAAQCIWLARVRPEDCENIVRFTVLLGKVVKPGRQLRGGFDRTRCLTSW